MQAAISRLPIKKPPKYLLIAVAVCAVLLFIGSQFLSMFVDEEQLTLELASRFKQMTGQELAIGDVSVHIGLSSYVAVERVAIDNPSELNKDFMFKATQLRLYFSLMQALTSGQPQMQRVEMISPVLNLERNVEGVLNLQHLLQPDNAAPHSMNSLAFDVRDGQIFYFGLDGEETYQVTDLAMHVETSGEQIEYHVSGNINEQPSQVSGKCALQPFDSMARLEAACQLDATLGQTSIQAGPEIALQQGTVQLTMPLSIASEDLRPFLDAVVASGGQRYSTYFTKSLPLQAKGSINKTSQRMTLSLPEISSGNSAGKLNVMHVYAQHASEQSPELNLQLALNTLDYDAWVSSIRSATHQESTDILALDSGFPKDLAGEVNISIERMPFKGIELRDVVLNGEWQQGQLTVPDAHATLPDGGRAFALGQFTTSEQGLRYDGLVEASGSSIATLSPLMGLEVAPVFKQAFSQYRTRFNIIVRPTLTTVSELRLLVNERIKVAGGINYEPDKVAQATLRVENINLKPFEQYWLGNASLLESYDKQPSDQPFGFTWLQGVSRPYSLNLFLNDATAFGMNITQSQLGIKVEPGKLSIEPANIQLDDNSLRGRFTVERRADMIRPLINAQLRLARLEITEAVKSMFAPQQSSGAVKPRPSQSIWSDVPMNLYPLHYADARVEFRAGTVLFEDAVLEKVQAIIKLNDRQLRIENGRSTLWNGQMVYSVRLDAGAVPQLELNCSIAQAKLKNVLQQLTELENISGLTSLSLRMTTAGVSLDQWLLNGNGFFGFEARNIFVQQFNLPAIIRAITNLRSVSGLKNTVRLAFDGGSTRFSNVKGVMALEKGILKATEIQFRSNESIGTMAGTLDVRRWVIDMVLTLGLVTLSPQNYPEMILAFKGPFDDPEQELNLQSIESYLAEKIR